VSPYQPAHLSTGLKQASGEQYNDLALFVLGGDFQHCEQYAAASIEETPKDCVLNGGTFDSCMRTWIDAIEMRGQNADVLAPLQKNIKVTLVVRELREWW